MGGAMRDLLRAFGLALSLSTVAACSAEWNSVQHEFAATTNKVATIDAKQRVVAMQENQKKLLSVCVEQSPDVFSFLSSSTSMSAETKKLVASLAAAAAESGGSLAFRTQVTQAQANLLYTVCQLHAAGGLSDRAVRAELRRFQQTLMGILAIEQLTAPTRQMAAQQVLTTSNASVGKDVEVAQAKVDAAKKAVDDAETAVKAAQGEVDKTTPAAGASPSEEHKKALRTKDEKDTALAKAKDDLDIAQKQLQAARLALTASASGAQQSVINVYTSPGGSVSDKVAESVVRIAETTLHRGTVIDSCIERILEEDAKDISDTAWMICDNAFKTYIQTYAASNAAYDEAMKADSVLRSKVVADAQYLLSQKRIGASEYKEIVKTALGAETPGKSSDRPTPRATAPAQLAPMGAAPGPSAAPLQGPPPPGLSPR